MFLKACSNMVTFFQTIYYHIYARMDIGRIHSPEPASKLNSHRHFEYIFAPFTIITRSNSVRLRPFRMLYRDN